MKGDVHREGPVGRLRRPCREGHVQLLLRPLPRLHEESQGLRSVQTDLRAADTRLDRVESARLEYGIPITPDGTRQPQRGGELGADVVAEDLKFRSQLVEGALPEVRRNLVEQASSQGAGQVGEAGVTERLVRCRRYSRFEDRDD